MRYLSCPCILELEIQESKLYATAIVNWILITFQDYIIRIQRITHGHTLESISSLIVAKIAILEIKIRLRM